MKLLILILIMFLSSCMAYPEGQGPIKKPTTRWDKTTGELETIYDMGGGMSFDNKGNLYIEMP